MNPILVYFVKVNIALALFYLFYRLLFAGDTLWKIRRTALLLSIAISFSYPLLSISNWLQTQAPMQTLMLSYVQLQEVVITPENAVVPIDWAQVIILFYMTISAGLLLKLIVQLMSVLRLRSKSTPLIIQGIKVHCLPGKVAPFSFFGSIYLNPDLHNERELREILEHEQTHVRQMHSFDVLVAETLTIVCWINPAVWLLRREIRHNLEFLADNQVIASGFDSRSYQYHLLQLTYQLPHHPITNQFNISPLKKRITMMNQAKTPKAGLLKYLLLVPLALALVVSSNAETIISAARESLSNQPTVQEAATTPAVAVLPSTEAQTPKPQSTEAQKKDAVVKPQTNELGEVHVIGYPPAQVPNTPPPPPPTGQDGKTPPPPPPPPAKDDDDVIFNVVEKMPSYPGGDAALFKYLSNNIKYPVIAQTQGIQGRVICQFVIDRDGKISDIEVVRSVDISLDAEAKRVIAAMPDWTPGTQRGKAVRVKYTLPINFRLQGGTTTNEKVESVPTSEVLKEISKQPLIVVDGKVMEEGFDLNILKKEDIIEVTVLKAEAAKAMESQYGPRVADGIILIKMKK